MPSMPLKVTRRVGRFSGQEWELNAAIALQGPEWDQPRLGFMATVCGHDSGADFTALRHAITKYNDISREMMKAARRRGPHEGPQSIG